MGTITVIKELLESEAAKGQKIMVIIRFVLAHIRFLFHDSFEFAWVNGTRMNAVKHRPSSTACYYYGYFDKAEMNCMKKMLKVGDVFIDVGANVGAYSIYAASLGLETYAFEPVDSTYCLMMENVKLNNGFNKLIHPRRVVVGNKNEAVCFTVDQDSMNHVVLDEIQGGTEKTEMIEGVRLDDIVSECEAIKIDVEGFEREVLMGAKNILASSRLKFVIIERPDMECRTILNKSGLVECGCSDDGTISGGQLKNSKNSIFIRK